MKKLLAAIRENKIELALLQRIAPAMGGTARSSPALRSSGITGGPVRPHARS